LITPVGAPLEDVVGSAETPGEGGTHLKMELVAVPYNNYIIGTKFANKSKNEKKERDGVILGLQMHIIKTNLYLDEVANYRYFMLQHR